MVNGQEKTATSAACTKQVTFEKQVEDKQPVFECKDLTLIKNAADRSVTAKVTVNAQNGAKFKTVTYNFGDGEKSVFSSTELSKSYKYSADGTYTVTARVLFDVNGVDKFAADNQACVKTVTFTTPTTPENPTNPETPQTPQVLPATGAGSVIGIFVAVVAVSTFGYRLLLSRKA
jgi:hypothetical protein